MEDSIGSPEPRQQHLQLLRRMQNGDATALDELFGALGGLIFGVGLRLLRQQEEAEELVCDVFARAWRSAANFDSSRGSVVSWLVIMTRSMALDRMRTAGAELRRRSEPLDERLPLLENDLLDAAIASDRKSKLRTALTQLPDAQRTVVMLAYFGGFSQTEIADQLGEPLGTVKTRTRLGLLRLKALLEGQV
jgi:RNA polymerase sigma-70 factor, ECF subfamily